MSIHDVYHKLSLRFRRERMRRFFDVMAPTEQTRILDIGGYPWVWDECGFEVTSKFTILNPHLPPLAKGYQGPQYDLVLGDGTALEYADGEFDIVFSNSVIEHLGTFEKQTAFANECMRVGKRYWVQTPAQEFPIEPHYIAPFIHAFGATVYGVRFPIALLGIGAAALRRFKR